MSFHPKYRPDIDGLRAIAILGVVIFHAFPTLLPGGFIGVDIFFVISGYLISTILINQQNAGVGFKAGLKDFYARRIKRIFPALIAVLIFSYALGWFVLYADEYKTLSKHVVAGITFFSNFAYWKESGYFDATAESKPLLHLWSLAVEEQFYIVWPLILYACHRFRLPLLRSVMLLLVASLGVNIYLSYSSPTAAFYSPLSRFWEMMIGCVLAIETLRPSAMTQFLARTRIQAVSSVLGAGLIGAGFAFIHKDQPFPGMVALLPTLGAYFMIAAGPQAWLNRVVLANPLMVWIGLISYPLYLWHWPLLTYANIIEHGEAGDNLRSMAVVLSILFAWLTYQLIEKPVRFGRAGVPVVRYLSGAMAALLVLTTGGYAVKGIETRAINQVAAAKQDTKKPEFRNQMAASCPEKLGIKARHGETCVTKTDKPRVLFLGDSHAMAISHAAFEKDMALEPMLIFGHTCLPFEDYVTFNAKQTKAKQRCREIAREMLEVVKTVPSIETVILNTRGPFYFTGSGYGVELSIPGENGYRIEPYDAGMIGKISSQEAFVAGYLQFIAALEKTGKRVVFVIDPPELGIEPRNCIGPRGFSLTGNPVADCRISRADVEARQKEYRELVAQIAAQHPTLELFDSMPHLCDDTTCYGKRDGHVYYYDDDHVGVKGSEVLLEALIHQLQHESAIASK